MGCVCDGCGVGVRGVLDGVMDATVVVFPTATVEPLRATESHITFSKSHCRATPSH